MQLSLYVLIDIAKHHEVQLPWGINLEMLRTPAISHLSSGECAECNVCEYQYAILIGSLVQPNNSSQASLVQF